MVASGQLTPYPIITPVDTFWTQSVVYWQDWMSSSPSSPHSHPWTTDYRKPDCQRRLESHALAVPEVQQLIREENVSYFLCDTTNIRGTSTSESMDHDIRDIDEFPLLRCRELVEPVTEEYLQRNMHHWGLRLDRVLFAECSWAERRLCRLNDDGSYHLGTARYQTCRLDIAIPLTDKLCRYGINVPVISTIHQQWHLFTIPTDKLFSSSFDVVNVFEYPFGNSGLSCYMHNTDKSGAALKLVWPERGHPRASTVTNIFSIAGSLDFGRQPQQLAKGPSPR